MATPVVYSVSPSSGHTGGGQLLTLSGANFATPPPPVAGPRIHGPWPAGAGGISPVSQATAFPLPPSVQVLFGADMVPATNVAVISPGIIQCSTPVHDPSGIPYIEPTPNRAGQVAVPPSDVTVVNLDVDGNPVPGETFTLTQAYSFLRPNFTMPGVAWTVLQALVLDLQRQILPNVEFNPHTDYDPTSGDFLNLTMPGALPGLAIMNLKMPQATGRPRAVEEEVTFTTSTGYVVNRLAVLRDLVLTVLGVSDNQGELLGLAEGLEVYFRRTAGVTVLANSGNPLLGTVTFPAYRETDTVFTGRIGTSNVVAFTFTMRISTVPFADYPGITQDSTALGATFAGPNNSVIAQSVG
jgi:hypothetical protein